MIEKCSINKSNHFEKNSIVIAGSFQSLASILNRWISKKNFNVIFIVIMHTKEQLSILPSILMLYQCIIVFFYLNFSSSLVSLQ